MVGKRGLVKANEFNLTNHYILYKENMTSYKHLAFVKFCKMTKIKNQNGCWQRPDAKCANEKK